MTKAEAAVAVAEAAAMIAQAVPRPVRKGGWHRAPPALGGCLVGVTGRLARASGRRVVSTPGAATCAMASRSDSAGCCHMQSRNRHGEPSIYVRRCACVREDGACDKYLRELCEACHGE